MARVKRALNAQKKRRTVLKASKGYRGQRSRLYRKAKEQQLHSLTYAYRDRRARKGEFRKLWISRINAAARANDITYNRLDPGPQGRRRRGGPQEPCRDRGQRPGCVHRSGRGGQGRVARGCQRSVRRGRLTSAALTERSARVVAAAKLHRHVGRTRAARFLAEGPNLVEAALRRGLVDEVFATEDALHRYGAMLDGAPVHVVTEKAAKALSDTVTPVGLVAVCSMPEGAMADVLAAEPRLVAGCRRNLRTRQRRDADPAGGRNGRRRRRPGRARRRPLQREVPARLGGKHLLTPRARGHRHRRGGRRAAASVCGCWPRHSTARCPSTTQSCPRQPRGCSDRRPMGSRPRLRGRPTRECPSRCTGPPRV